jgi:hypothetical protein
MSKIRILKQTIIDLNRENQLIYFREKYNKILIGFFQEISFKIALRSYLQHEGLLINFNLKVSRYFLNFWTLNKHHFFAIIGSRKV